MAASESLSTKDEPPEDFTSIDGDNLRASPVVDARPGAGLVPPSREIDRPAEGSSSGLSLLSRDPNWGYVSWRIPLETIGATAAGLRRAEARLRIREVGSKSPALDEAVTPAAGQYFFRWPCPGRAYEAALSIVSADGRERELARSAPVEVPAPAPPTASLVEFSTPQAAADRVDGRTLAATPRLRAGSPWPVPPTGVSVPLDADVRAHLGRSAGASQLGGSMLSSHLGRSAGASQLGGSMPSSHLGRSAGASLLGGSMPSSHLGRSAGASQLGGSMPSSHLGRSAGASLLAGPGPWTPPDGGGRGHGLVTSGLRTSRWPPMGSRWGVLAANLGDLGPDSKLVSVGRAAELGLLDPE